MTNLGCSAIEKRNDIFRATPRDVLSRLKS